MRTLQNQDAVNFFVNDIFPGVKEKIPSAMFYIIGAEPPPYIQHLSDKINITVSGFVPSVEDVIKDAAVSVAPVRIASGIQNKVLLSMACGVPVVLSSLIAKGIPELVHEKNCIISDMAEDFALAIVKILQDKQLRNFIARNGYELVKTLYSWDEKLKGYEEGV
jgi:glycosyltransferase involved in cell wall biosynthesis